MHLTTNLLRCLGAAAAYERSAASFLLLEAPTCSASCISDLPWCKASLQCAATSRSSNLSNASIRDCSSVSSGSSPASGLPSSRERGHQRQERKQNQQFQSLSAGSLPAPARSTSFAAQALHKACSPWSLAVASRAYSTSAGALAAVPQEPTALEPALQEPHSALSTQVSPNKVQNFYVGLDNLRDNPGARKQKIRAGHGDSGRRGNYAGRGMKGQKARGRGLHILFDGGQLGLLKFPVARERPPYEVLYTQLGLSRVVEFVQLGLLDPSRTITMKDLQDSGCVSGAIKYGVMLYGQARLPCPLDIQVTACDDAARMAVERAGGKVTRVYYTKQGLEAVLRPSKYTSKRLPLPPPALAWHPKYNGQFDEIGAIPPMTRAQIA